MTTLQERTARRQAWQQAHPVTPKPFVKPHLDLPDELPPVIATTPRKPSILAWPLLLIFHTLEWLSEGLSRKRKPGVCLTYWKVEK